jgi:hypothetical protein
MKSSQFFKVLLVCFAVALATSAFAAQKGNFQVSDPVVVNGTQLPAGDYVAKWEGTGNNVKVDITRNGTVVATAPAKVVELNQKASEDAVEISTGAGGKRELTTLRFSGKKIQLELGSSPAEAAGVK